jgi:hypothetical protein
MGHSYYLSACEAEVNSYPVLRSTLEGIFSARTGLTDEEAASGLLKDLAHQPFREALKTELDAAFVDPDVRWRALLEEFEVAYFATDEEAKQFIVQRLQRPADSFSSP